MLIKPAGLRNQPEIHTKNVPVLTIEEAERGSVAV